MSRKSALTFPQPVTTIDSIESLQVAATNPVNAQFDLFVAKCVKDGSLTLSLPADGVKAVNSLSHHAIKQNMTLASNRAGIKLACSPSAKLPNHWVWFPVKAK